jgi:hypothetical protein
LYTFSARTIAPIQIVHDRLWDTGWEQPYSVLARVLPGTSAVSADLGERVSYRVSGGALHRCR